MSDVIFDVMKEVEAAEDPGEECAPLGVVVGFHVQCVRDQGLDGNTMNSVREEPWRRQCLEKSRCWWR
jgi:hypothetical protein